MSDDPVFSGPFSGRFYRLDRAMDLGSSLVSRALMAAWVGTPAAVFERGFCRGSSPHDGDLGDDAVDLSYCDGGTGIWRLWIREDSRKVPKSAVMELAARLAFDRDPDTSLRQSSRSVRSSLEEAARYALLKQAIPATRVIPVVAGRDEGGWIWIGRSGCASDRSYVQFLRSVVGDLELDPVVWSSDGGWATSSYATLVASTKVRGGRLAPDVFLRGIDVKGTSLHVKASDGVDIGALLEKMGASSETSVRSLSFEILKDGVSVQVDVDAHGVCRVSPMRSAGGLPADRLRRRFSDARSSCGRVRSVMADAVEEASGS